MGGVTGGAAVLTLLGRRRLAFGLALVSLMVGVSLMLVGAVAAVFVAAPMLVVVGIGYALIEVAGISLLSG